MLSKKESIEYAKRDVGWAYYDLKRLTEEEAKRKNQEREKILRSLSNGVKYAFKRSKIYCGNLSLGCLRCGQGTWSCMFINGLCTENCFFCTQDRKMKKERPPSADGIIFNEPKAYVDYLERFGLRGVGFSGGESLLVFDKLLSFITKIRQRFRKGIYLWIYTNGDLVNRDRLKNLKKAGLDEIRFNICARNYDLGPVELAVGFIDVVTVEIPAIPEDYSRLKRYMAKMEDIGVDHLNLHQLISTVYNYKNFISRNYTFLHLPDIPILESEMTALKLIKYAIDNHIRLAINYCNRVYKWRFQDRGYRRRIASLARADFEGETDSGYIRRLSIKGRPAGIGKTVKALRRNRCRENLWSLDKTGTELSIHHSLLRYIDFKNYNLIISYFEPGLKEEIGLIGNHKEIRLNSKNRFFIERVPAAKEELSLAGAECFYKLFIEHARESNLLKHIYENYNLKTKGGISNMEREIAALISLKRWEEVEKGFLEIY